MYRWSDDQKQWGPFIFCRDKYNKNTGFYLDINNRWGDKNHTMMHLSLFGYTCILLLHSSQDYRAKQGRRYGFMIHTEHDVLYLNYGKHKEFADSDDPNQEISWYFPWCEMEHVRHSYYDTKGNHLFDSTHSWRLGGSSSDLESWDREQNRVARIEPLVIPCIDYDGEKFNALIRIEEREWRRGRGSWKFLRWFTRPKIERYIEMHFDKEVGKRKSSWKGGMIATSTPLIDNNIYSSFSQFCMRENITVESYV